MGSKAIKMKDTNGNSIYPCPYYPVGSIYISVNDTKPSTYFGGTWERIQDKFLLCAGSTYGAGTTGGNANHIHSTGNHTLTVDEISAHNHPVVITTQVLWYGTEATWGNIARANGNNGQAEEKYNYSWSSNTGGGQAHNHGNTGGSSNLPPYLAVYVWKRTG